jgi:hypothetical protein
MEGSQPRCARGVPPLHSHEELRNTKQAIPSSGLAVTFIDSRFQF